MLAFGDDTMLQQNGQVMGSKTILGTRICMVSQSLTVSHLWAAEEVGLTLITIGLDSFFVYMCQLRTLYSPILVFHFVIVFLRLALASNTFIVYAYRKSFFIRPKALEMYNLNPPKI